MALHKIHPKIISAREVLDVDFEVVLEWFEVGEFFFVEKVKVELEKCHEFLFSWLVVGEAVGVFENAATNHKTVDAVFLTEFGSLCGGFDVAVDEELGFGGDGVF